MITVMVLVLCLMDQNQLVNVSIAIANSTKFYFGLKYVCINLATYSFVSIIHYNIEAFLNCIIL